MTSELNQLRNLSVTRLQERWQRQIGRGAVPLLKVVLLRELVWHVQGAAGRIMDMEAQALLRSAVRLAQKEPVGTLRTAVRPMPLRNKRLPDLQPGVRLVRTWHGVPHEVTVLDAGKGFAYRGETCSSLTQIAKRITGAHWSGPRFFGLHRARTTR